MVQKIENIIGSKLSLRYDIDLNPFRLSLVTSLNVLHGQFVMTSFEGDVYVFKKIMGSDKVTQFETVNVG